MENKKDTSLLEENLKHRIYLADMHRADFGLKSVIFNLYQALLVARELKKVKQYNLLKKNEKTDKL
jgi:hypothetical protein